MTVAIQLLLVAILAACCWAQQPSSAADSSALDSSDWIPMRQPCPTCHGEKQLEGTVTGDQVPQKTSRVLNTAVAFQRNNYPRINPNHFLNGLEKRAPPHLSSNLVLPLASNQYLNQVPRYGGFQFETSHLSPQFLPHLEQANFNGNLQAPQLFVQPAQGFLSPQAQRSHLTLQRIPERSPLPQQQQYIQYLPQNQLQQSLVQQPLVQEPLIRQQPLIQQPIIHQQQGNLIQPQNDFHLLQQILNSQNTKFVQTLLMNDSIQAQPPKVIPLESSSTTTTTEKVSQESSASPEEKSKEEVQLLYVPLETLRQRGPAKVKTEVSTTEKAYHPYRGIQSDINQQLLQAQNFQNTIQTSATSALPTQATPAPIKKKNKLKPHQPPLAMFMGSSHGEEEVKVTDVLTALGSARTIDVLDQVTSKMPLVFVGPSSMKPPNGYAKFDLPYLSNLDSNRIQRKVEQLPFFVAPLSYNTPDGYSKIPFPPPHVGSIVIRDMKDLYSKPDDPINSYFASTYKEPTTKQTNYAFNTPSPTRNYISTETSSFGGVSSTVAPSTQNTRQYFPSPTAAVEDGALGNYYFTKPSATKNYQSTRYQSTTSKPLISSTPSSLSDYTVLEQFPVKETFQKPHRHQVSQLPQEVEQTTKFAHTNSYAQYNLENLRNPPDDGAIITGTRIKTIPTSTTIQGNVYSKPPSPTTPSSTIYTSPKPNTYYSIPADGETSHYVLPTVTPPNLSGGAPVYSQQVYEQQRFAQIPKHHYQQQQVQQQQVQEEPVLIGNQQLKSTTEGIRNPTYQTTYYQEVPSSVTPASNIHHQEQQEYSLPAELPPINPNLPNLINSLQQPQHGDSSSESSSQHTTTHEPTRRPSTVAVTPRGRQRTYNRPQSYPTTTQTPSITSPTVRVRTSTSTPVRRRRPTGRTREYPTTTYPPQDATQETTEPTTLRPTRTRYNQESELKAVVQPNNRSRFRTRGRQTSQRTSTTTTTTTTTTTPPPPPQPVTVTPAAYIPTERNSVVYPEQGSFHQPQIQTGFQISSPFGANDQRPIYRPVSNIPPEITQDLYNQNLKQTYFAETQEEGTTENPSKIYQQTTPSPQPVYPSSTATPQYTYSAEPQVISQTVGGEGDYVRFNSASQVFTPRSSSVTPSGSGSVRIRGKTGRTRTRNYPTTTEPTTTTTEPTTVKDNKQEAEEEEEFFGFLRNPILQPPGSTHYQNIPAPIAPKFVTNDYFATARPQYYNPSTVQTQGVVRELQTDRPQYISTIDRSQYVSTAGRPTETPYYSQTERSSTENEETVYVKGSLSELPESYHPIYRQDVVSTTEETYRQPSTRFVRPTNAPAYTVRPSKRPETEGNRIVKVRGRIRKPTTTTTEEGEYYTDGLVSPSNVHEQTTKDPKASRRYPNRGKAHFTLPDNVEADHEEEEPNYPASFLHPEESQTKRSDFKITVSPSTGEYSSDDQIPYHSITRPKIYNNPEDGGAESQWNGKYAIPNDIPIEDKKDPSTTTTTTSTPSPVEVTSNGTKDEDIPASDGKSIFEQIFEEMAKFGLGDSTTTESATSTTTESKVQETVGELKVTKGKRRGYWKRIRVRPVDGLEAAESQNIGTANLISDSVKMTHPRPTIEQYMITFEPMNRSTVTEESTLQQEDITTTLLPEINTLQDNATENNPPEETTTESIPPPETTTLFDPSSSSPPPPPPGIQTLDASTENQINETKIISDKIKMYTERLEEQHRKGELGGSSITHQKIKIVDPFVIGTSTSTEIISHETEICYRGRCIKTNSTDTGVAVPSPTTNIT